ncbi:MAG: helix-turn-helix transcriptional regulator [Myxococcales bacterium]|nr:helix-turn-helix transcriptional regulator [Myxococcales bacterium]
MESSSAVRSLAALAQASRLAVFRALVQAGPGGMTAGAIARETAVAPSALSFHLKELSHAGLVHAAPRGRFIDYAANFAAMNQLLAFLTENCCGGASCAPAGKSKNKADCAPKRKRNS